jgi:hypothetical protein
MNNILQLSIFFISFFSIAQPNIDWHKCIGGTGDEHGYSIQQTLDGGYIVLGSTTSNDGDVSGNHGLNDVWVVKLSTIGDVQWQKCLGGSNEDNGYSIQQTLDGGYIVIGSTTSNNGDVSGIHGTNLSDIWVVKLSSLGDIQWQKCLGGTSQDTGSYIKQTSDGGFILTGTIYSNNGDVSGNHGLSDVWVVKLSSLGDIQWQKCLGGTNIDITNSIQQTIDGSYVLISTTSSNDGDVSGNHGQNDVWVVKLSSLGLLQWQKCLGGTIGEAAGLIQQTLDGGYVLIGFTNSNDGNVSGNHGSGDIWVVKLSSLGVVQWQRCLGGSGADDRKSIKQTSDQGYVIIGYTRSNDGDVSGNHGQTDIWVVKLSSLGVIQWQKCIGGSGDEQGYSIQQTSDEGYVFTGLTSSNDGDVSGNHGGQYDLVVLKLSSFLEIEESIYNSLILSPNPVVNILNIRSNDDLKNQPYTIIDSLGRDVLYGKLNEVESTINVEQLSKGIYYLIIDVNSASKFIKE